MIINSQEGKLDEHFWPDEMLAEGARQGSGAAVAALLERYGDAVYSIVLNMCATSSEADKVTQQTFISACRDMASMRTAGSFRTWLYGAAIKTALAGKQGGRPNETSSQEPFPTRFDEAGHLTAVGGRWLDLADTALEDKEVTGRLRETLERIDDNARAAFVLCDLAEIPAKEAATILHASPEEIRRRVHRARLMLLGTLDKWFSVKPARREEELDGG